MKKFFNTLFVIIAAMVTFAACVKEENAPASEIKTVQFFAESIQTKTAFGTPDGTSYPTLWTENDAKVKLSLNYASPKDADVDEVSDDFKTAHFSAEIKDDESGEYTFYALSPASAFNSFSEPLSYLSANIPTTQAPLANSVDEKAQILYAVSEQFDEMPSSVSLNFHHFTAYGKLSFVNLGLGDATVTSVTITSSVNFAGRWNYMVKSGEFMVNSGSKEITLTTSDTENLWFACAPVDMNNQTLTFTVNTDKGPLAKTVTLTGKKFEAGKIAAMKVDMTGVQFAESVVYDLVTDPSDLTANSKVIIVAAESDVALSVTQNSNNRGEASVTKSADKSAISDPGSAVQIMTIEDGTKNGTISFNVGNGYLYAASSSSNYLRTESTKSDNSSWKVTITDGVATIIAQGANTRNTMQYNNSNNLFSCYGSASQKKLAIYKLKGTGTAALPKLDLEVEDIELTANESEGSFAVISSNIASIEVRTLVEEGAQEESEWLVAEYDEIEKCVTYSAASNDSEGERTAYIEVYALDAEGNELVKGVNVTQAGKIISDNNFEAGNYWIIEAEAGLAMMPLAGNYGYPTANLATMIDGVYKSFEANVFTIEYQEDVECYTIMDSNQKYLYMNTKADGSWYTSFNVSAEYEQNAKYHWAITTNDAGKHIITNLASAHKIAYSSAHSSWGAYADPSTYALPTLVKFTDPLAVELVSIAVSGQKTTFTIGEEFEFGGSVTATYNDESTADVTSDATFTGYDMSNAGSYEVTVTYGGKTCTYDITVAESGGDLAPKFVKVTSAPSDWSGTYLIVCESGSVAFDGSLNTLDAVSNTKTVTISDNEIEATDEMKAITFEIAKNGSGYTVKSKSGYYVGQSSDANGLKSNKSTSYNHTISLSSNGVNMISGGAYLRYNATSGQTRFRYYKSSSYTNQQAIQLYKLED